MTEGGARSRLVGLDVARCLALLGMVATHILDERGADGGLSFSQWLAGGRASALFAVLAGVSLALMTGRRKPVVGRDRLARSAGLVVRALLIAALGLALGELESGLAVILTYYGLLFLLAIAFVGLRARSLLVVAGGWVMITPVLSHLVRPSLPERRFDNPTFGQLADPGPLLSELAFTGYYPVVPWLAYLLVGLALGRIDLRSPRVQTWVACVGLSLAVSATLLSRLLTRDRDPQELEDISSGMFGTTPTGGDWDWLLVVAPHSATPFDLTQTIGSALVVIGLSLLVLGALPRLAERATAIVFGAGTMTLTLYSLHVLLRTEDFWPPERASAYAWHVLVLLWIGAAYVALRHRGPLERVVGDCSEVVSGLILSAESRRHRG